MELPDIISLSFHKVQKDRLSHISQIPRDDPVVLLRLPLHIMQVLNDRIHRRRRHACPHILRVLQSVVHDLSHCNACDPHMAFPRPDQEGAASGHGPVGGQRSLAGIAQRETELLLRAPEVAGRHGKHILSVPRRCAHCSQRERLAGCGACPIQPEHGDLQRLHAHGGGDTLPEQIPAEQIPHFLRFHMRLSKCQRTRLLLHIAFRFLPGLRAEQIVLIHHIEQLRQRTLRLLAPRHRRRADNIGSLRKHNALTSSYLIHNPVSISDSSSGAPFYPVILFIRPAFAGSVLFPSVSWSIPDPAR